MATINSRQEKCNSLSVYLGVLESWSFEVHISSTVQWCQWETRAGISATSGSGRNVGLFDKGCCYSAQGVSTGQWQPKGIDVGRSTKKSIGYGLASFRVLMPGNMG